MKILIDFKTFNENKINKSDDEKLYQEYLTMNKDELEVVGKEYRILKIKGKNKLQIDFPGIMEIDLNEDEIAEYLQGEDKDKFLKYSRILDFKDGYKPVKD
jgi:hypothetical protein